MELVCSLCRDCSKNAYLNVETIQIGEQFIPISDMTKVFKDLEEMWISREQKNICIDCLQDLQSSYLFYKKCLKSNRLLSDSVEDPKKVNATTRKEEKIEPYRCCDQLFSTKVQLNKHKRHAHASIFRFPCRSCPRKFLTIRSLRIHEISHRKVKSSPEWYCNLCQRQFKHRGIFMKHKERHEDVVCYYCNRGFAEAEITKKHIANHHEKNEKCFSCVNCKKSFDTRKILLRHFRTVHATTIPMFCGKCEASFDDREKLMNHLVDCDKKKTIEDDEYWNIEHLIDDDLNLTTEWLNYEMLSDDYLNVDNGESMVEEFLDDAFEMLAEQNEELKCHHCSTVFMTSRELIMHDITNHDNVKKDTTDGKPATKYNPCYKCPRCQEQFSKQSNLTIHLAHHHGEFVLFCNECGAAYNEITKLRAHRKEHRTENMNTPLVDHQNIRDGKSLCNLCDKFFTKSGLRYHLKTHSNVIRAFACPFCEKTFIANTNLNAHIRIRHSETKQHPCSHCFRRFGSKDHLKKHTASVHLHIRNYKCENCDKSFRQKSHLNQHLWQHTGVKQYQCSLCINAYTSKPSLRKHILKIHSLVE